MGITDIALKIAAPYPKIESFQRFLFVGPHPDDIEIGAGATAAKLAANGKSVRFVICTDGRYGDGNLTSSMSEDALAALREQEAIASAARLGVSDVRFLRFSDGAMYDYSALRESLAREIGEFKPDVIFCPDPDVKSECHADHLNVGRAAKELACFAPYKNIMRNYGADSAAVQAVAFYMTASANSFVNTSGYLPVQLSAIFDCHLSQFPVGSNDAKAIKLYLKLRSHDFGLRRLCRTAEGFRVLGTTHMHCLPEAGK